MYMRDIRSYSVYLNGIRSEAPGLLKQRVSAIEPGLYGLHQQEVGGS
jgi:hypothetical protein